MLVVSISLVVVSFPLYHTSFAQSVKPNYIFHLDEDVETDAKKYQENLESYRKAALEKQRREKEKTSSDEEEDLDNNIEALEKLQAENRRKERQRKREEYEKKQSNNFLFTDEQLMEALSSSTEDEES